MLSCNLNTFLYVRIASITNVTIMANGKCIGILHNSCTDDNIETNPTKIHRKINERASMAEWNKLVNK